MSLSSIVRSRPTLALLALGVALLIAAARNGDGDDGGTTGGETPDAGETPAGGETPALGDTAGIRMLPGTTFDRAELTIAVGMDVTVTADNTDGTHNFAVYTEDPEEGG